MGNLCKVESFRVLQVRRVGQRQHLTRLLQTLLAGNPKRAHGDTHIATCKKPVGGRPAKCGCGADIYILRSRWGCGCAAEYIWIGGFIELLRSRSVGEDLGCICVTFKMGASKLAVAMMIMLMDGVSAAEELAPSPSPDTGAACMVFAPSVAAGLMGFFTASIACIF